MYISKINIFPIKSLRGIEIESAVVEKRGLQNDRRWMLTTPDGMFITQREFPKLATIGVELMSGGLRVTRDGSEPLDIPYAPDDGVHERVTIWNSVCDAVIYNNEVNDWFSDVIGTECQLVHMPDKTRRAVNPRFDRGDEIVSFADGYPLMMIGEASLADLNHRIAANMTRNDATGTLADRPLPMNRFRPSIVVSGSEPYAEDNWQRIKIGNVIFRSTKPCARCVITTIDQEFGEIAGKEPLKTLAEYRLAKNTMPERIAELGLEPNSVLFGQNLIPESAGGTLQIGDDVEVLD